LYVDDNAIIGTDEVINEVMTALDKAFQVKDLRTMNHFVGCHIIENKGKDTIYIHQPKLIKHLEEEFGSHVTTGKVNITPGAPNYVVMRPEKGDPLLTPEQETKYRSGVGMLLYLVKHSRHDISNAVRELTKVLDGATTAHWKAMLRVIKYVIDTKMLAIMLKQAYFDGEFAGDRETRASVYGFVIFVAMLPYHGNRDQMRVLHCLQLKLNIMVHLKLQKKKFLSRTSLKALMSYIV
jgi:hypothetical protein